MSTSFRLLSLALLGAAVLFHAVPASAAAPSNDLFAGATPITSFPYSDNVDIVEATLESSEPYLCGAQHTIWYVFTPPSNGVANLTASGTTFSDTVLNVWRQTATGLGGLTPITCFTFGGSAPLNVVAGETYYLQVGSIFSDGGNVQTTVRLSFTPANDNFADATTIPSRPYSDTVDITAATTEPGEPSACFFSVQTVWYKITPPSDAMLMVDNAGSAVPAINVNVWEATGPGIGDLSFVACSGGPSQPFQFAVEAGHTYYLQEELFYGNVPGSVTLNVQDVPPPAFDAIANATPISSLSFASSGSSFLATTAPDDPNCFGQGHTVWYSFTPSEDTSVEAAVQPEFSDSASHFTLSSYDGSPGSLHQLACSDDSLLVSGVPKAHIEILAKAGVTTYFMVGTSGGSPGGNFIFNAQRPLTIKSVPDANNNVTKEGVATVSGTLFCSRPIPEQVYVTLTQTFARLTAFGSNSSSGFACSPQGSRWTVELSSFPVAFGGGTAILSVQPTNQCDSQGCQPGALIGLGYSASFSSKIKLNRGK